MALRILYFASLREKVGRDAEELALVEAALGPPHVGRSDGPDAPHEQDREHDADQDAELRLLIGHFPVFGIEQREA